MPPLIIQCELGRARFRRIRRSRNAMATAGMRGLNIFIQDVRNAAINEGHTTQGRNPQRNP